MTNGVYLHLRFNPVMPTPMRTFIQACIKSPKHGLRYLSHYPELPEQRLALWGKHPDWPQWHDRSLTVNKDGSTTLQLASASAVVTIPTMKSFIEWVLPYTVSTGIVGLFITNPWVDYPKLVSVYKGKLQCHYCDRWSDLTGTTSGLELLEKISHLPQLLR